LAKILALPDSKLAFPLGTRKPKTMPRRKKTQQFYGTHFALAFHPEVKRLSAKHPGAIAGAEELRTVLEVAQDRYAFENSSKAARLIPAFGKIYRKDPDAILKFMLLLRRILSQWEKTEAGRVKKFLLTSRTTFIDRRIPVIDDKGNSTAIVVKSLLGHENKTVSTKGLSFEEVNNLYYSKLVHVGTLQDKEIAMLLNVKTESVKKARQSIAVLDARLAIWEHPEVKKFHRTGKRTPKLERFLKSLQRES
jgi:hypothetical protein